MEEEGEGPKEGDGRDEMEEKEEGGSLSRGRDGVGLGTILPVTSGASGVRPHGVSASGFHESSTTELVQHDGTGSHRTPQLKRARARVVPKMGDLPGSPPRLGGTRLVKSGILSLGTRFESRRKAVCGGHTDPPRD
ncbi:hypothetical protein Sjap_007326 [Stephania japonica]|uniref:Uncharacterized protein n=1 Tax=Stephania japonica TaxID=461633 RepID=A0AAP0PAB5_9MAGN